MNVHLVFCILFVVTTLGSSALQPYRASSSGPASAVAADPFHLDQFGHGRAEEHGYKILDQGLAPNADKVKMFPPLPDLGNSEDHVLPNPKPTETERKNPIGKKDNPSEVKHLENGGSIEFQDGKIKISQSNAGMPT